MEKLQTTKEIAELYGVSSYTIVTNWCNKGLKFIKGKQSFLFRQSWVEQFLEEEAERQSMERCNKNVKPIANITIKPRRLRTKFNSEMKII